MNDSHGIEPIFEPAEHVNHNDMFADIFENQPPVGDYRLVVRRGSRAMRITYHQTHEDAEQAGTDHIAKLCADDTEISMGYGKASDYDIRIGPAIEAPPLLLEPCSGE